MRIVGAVALLIAISSLCWARPAVEVLPRQFNPEYEVVQPALYILCPQCRAPLYACEYDNFWDCERPDWSICHPVASGIPDLTTHGGNNVYCPFDGEAIFKDAGIIRKGPLKGQRGITFLTNKGWLPQKDRIPEEARGFFSSLFS